MKCKRHNNGDGAGVCASCLRERLLALVAARVEHSPVHSPSPPQPLPLPASFSPLSFRRRSDASDASRLPHLSSGALDAGPSSASAAVGPCARSDKFSILSTLFGHRHPRSEEAKPDPGTPKSPRSGHWLPGLIHGRRNKKMSRLFSADDAVLAAARSRRSCRSQDRGLSPERGGSAPESGYNTESPGGRWWHPTPSPRRRATAEHHHHQGRGLAGFAVCLSPLVRPTGPSRRRFHGAGLGFSGDLQRSLSPNHHWQAGGGEPALFPNRSRKLAELGRFR